MIFEYLQERFGIPPDAFKDFQIYGGSKGKVYLGPKKLISKPDIVSLGILVARAESSVKPTTNLLQLFGHLASKNIVRLDKKEAVSFAKGEDLQIKDEASDGYVLVKFENNCLGCGLLKENLLINQIPKAKRQQVKYI